MKEENRKKYAKPAMRVYQLREHPQLLIGSGKKAAPTSASIDDYESGEFSWQN